MVIKEVTLTYNLLNITYNSATLTPPAYSHPPYKMTWINPYNFLGVILLLK